ncbi:hypothetical protein NOGI109294_19875 [Nocardiopsis gilva]
MLALLALLARLAILARLTGLSRSLAPRYAELPLRSVRSGPRVSGRSRRSERGRGAGGVLRDRRRRRGRRSFSGRGRHLRVLPLLGIGPSLRGVRIGR